MVSATANPITSVPDNASPITSVAPTGDNAGGAAGGMLPPFGYSTYPPSITNRLHIDLRGVRMTVDRETLMTLPESVLLCLFPNGLVLSPLGGTSGLGGDEVLAGDHEGSAGNEHGDEDNEVYVVDYDPDSFRYVLDFWHSARVRFYGDPSSSTSSQSGIYHLQQALLAPPAGSPGGSASASNYSTPPYGAVDAFSMGGLHNDNPLIQKQPIIVLREELEYFSIPPPSSKADHPLAGKANTDAKGAPSGELLRLKLECGKQLLEKRQVFTALQRNVSKEGNMAEQHLIDMLCMSGFSRDDNWGYRALEPARCCISSIALVLLKTGITHSSDGQTGEATGPVQVDHSQMATAQKLLLFWRKPAVSRVNGPPVMPALTLIISSSDASQRKCWWDGVEVDIPIAAGSSETAPVKVWARRVWTLELSLVRRTPA